MNNLKETAGNYESTSQGNEQSRYELILKQLESLQSELMEIPNYSEETYQGIEQAIESILYM